MEQKSAREAGTAPVSKIRFYMFANETKDMAEAEIIEYLFLNKTRDKSRRTDLACSRPADARCWITR